MVHKWQKDKLTYKNISGTQIWLLWLKTNNNNNNNFHFNFKTKLSFKWN